MSSQGSVIARVYTSDAYLPLADAVVSFTRILDDGSRRLLAIRRTDSSGLTAPVYVETPDTSQSLTPGMSVRPYASVDVQVEVPGYGGILAEGVQVFPGVETIQGLQLRPRPVTSYENGQTTVPGTSQNL